VKILQIFNRYLEFGGEEACVGRIGGALRDYGYKVEDWFTRSSDLVDSAWRQLRAPIDVLHNRSAGAHLRELQSRFGFDCWLIHNVFPTISPAGYQTAFELGVPVVQYLHSYRLGCVNSSFFRDGATCELCLHGDFRHAFLTACWRRSRLQSGLMGLVLKRVRSLRVFDRVSAWVAISAAQKQMHVRMGIDASKISVVPHFYPELPAPQGDGKRSDFLFIGRLVPEKGVDMLLRGWKQSGINDRWLHIVGDGPDRRRLEDLAAALGVRGVRFHGFLDQREHHRIWSTSFVAIVPSIWMEPFGLVVLEAWSNGCAVIASASGGLDETVDAGKNGLKVPPGDPAALATAMKMFDSQPSLAAEMAQAGRRKISDDYPVERWQHSISKVLEGAASGGRGRT